MKSLQKCGIPVGQWVIITIAPIFMESGMESMSSCLKPSCLKPSCLKSPFLQSSSFRWIAGACIGLGLGLAIAPGSLAQSVSASSAVELQVFPALEQDIQAAVCPKTVTLTEQGRPYTEGSYTTDGSAQLKNLASNFAIATSDEFSVTWVGQLAPRYRQCKATASIVKRHGETYTGPSYLRLRFVRGKLYLILDMTGMRDANDYTMQITKQAVQNGNPIWSTSGSD